MVWQKWEKELLLDARGAGQHPNAASLGPGHLPRVTFPGAEAEALHARSGAQLKLIAQSECSAAQQRQDQEQEPPLEVGGVQSSLQVGRGYWQEHVMGGPSLSKRGSVPCREFQGQHRPHQSGIHTHSSFLPSLHSLTAGSQDLAPRQHPFIDTHMHTPPQTHPTPKKAGHVFSVSPTPLTHKHCSPSAHSP